MNKNRFLQGRGKLVILVLLALLLGGSTLAGAQPRISIRFQLLPDVYISIPRSPQITLSIDKGEGANYYIDDPITIRYRANRDGYVNLIDYLPDGGVSILVRDEFIRSGEEGRFAGRVYGPAGVERIVVLLTPDKVSERDLESFIKSPHQADRIFGTRYATNRIHFQVLARMESTVLTIEPDDLTMDPGTSVVLTATLKDVRGRPITGEEIRWSANAGRLSASRTTTDLRGQGRVTFYAPSQPDTVTIEARFPGGVNSASASARATIRVERRTYYTTLEVAPSSFTIDGGGNVKLVATLKDENGKPVYGRTIYWEVTEGDLDKYSTPTDSSGKAVVYYYAPEVDEVTDVKITAQFRGVGGLAPASFEVWGTIEPLPVALTSSIFYLDFGSGTPRGNIDRLRYSGDIVLGFSLNDLYVLEMKPREAIEFEFNPGGSPREGAIFLWLQGESGGKARVSVNGNRLATISVSRDLIAPGGEEKIIIPRNVLVRGINRLRIEADPGRNIRVQKVIIVF